MKAILKPLFLMILLLSISRLFAQNRGYSAIYSGTPWFDSRGNIVSAHGGNIIKDQGRFYFFGERHSDTSNAFAGFNCYSSIDLYNWEFESVALPLQANGKLGPNRVGERPKVMKCPSTGEYLMYMHVDTLNYTDQFVGYATSKNIEGPYVFQGPLLFNGSPIKKWDMGTFQDKNGDGYVLLHGGDIFKLSDDYKSIIEQTCKAFERGFESPAMFRKDSLYYFLGSNLTSWEKNDNYYFTANSLKGPWQAQGLFAPENTLTWYSQTTFVLPIEGSKETTYMFMGDRWSFPKQASAATYVWQPVTIVDDKLSIPTFKDAWKINTTTGVALSEAVSGKVILSNDKQISYSGKWHSDTLSVKSSDEKSAEMSIKFSGTQVALYALARPDGGYCRIEIKNKKGVNVLTSIEDLYCKYPSLELKFLSPFLPKDKYTLVVTVMRERGNWSDKRRSDYGSKGYFVSLDKIIVKK